MNIEELRSFCLSLPHTTEGFPFDQDTLVFKVAGKMFCLASLQESDRINLKCDSDLALQLREQYPCVIPGYHMNKKMWNTVILDGSVPRITIEEWIKHSYSQVVLGLPKKVQKELNLI